MFEFCHARKRFGDKQFSGVAKHCASHFFWRDDFVSQKGKEAAMPKNTVVGPVSNSSMECITVISDGLTGEQLIAKLETAGYDLGNDAGDVKRIMRSAVVTEGVTYRVGIIKGEEFKEENRTTKKIRKEAARRHWQEPPVELAWLLREKLSNKDLEQMGLVWLVVMHKAKTASSGLTNLLGLNNEGGRRLGAFYSDHGHTWGHKDGFAFLIP